MDFPVEVVLGSWRIPAHGVLETLAYGVGFQTYRRLRRRAGDVLGDADRWWIIAAATVGALVGSRLLASLENPWSTFGHWGEANAFVPGRTLVGGLLGGLIAVEWTKRWLGITRRTGDLLVLPLCLGIAIGRTGCFLSGLDDRTAGIPTSLPWGVDFGDGLARHPTQLYEALFVLALGAFFLATRESPRPEGDAFRLFLVVYLGFRLACDFLKPGTRIVGGLTSIQWACIAGLIYYRRDLRRWLLPGPGAAEAPSAKSES